MVGSNNYVQGAIIVVIVGLLVFVVVFLIVFRFLGGDKLPTIPEPESEVDLIQQGYTHKEAKKEARAQRNEYKYACRAKADAVRAAAGVARTVSRKIKK